MNDELNQQIAIMEQEFSTFDREVDLAFAKEHKLTNLAQAHAKRMGMSELPTKGDDIEELVRQEQVLKTTPYAVRQEPEINKGNLQEKLEAAFEKHLVPSENQETATSSFVRLSEGKMSHSDLQDGINFYLDEK
jgi:hypothetical protein